ncbi:MAG: hypothetical protein HZC11_05595 [Nitrospirae bacterium]|nr:hypothetical protein [Nitrospirota bacterium]
MIKIIFYLLVLALLIYSGIQFAVPFYHYEAFKSDLSATVRVSVNTPPEEFRDQVINLADQYKIPLKMRNISFSKNGRYVVKASWEETVNIFDMYKRTFNFYVDTSNGG